MDSGKRDRRIAKALSSLDTHVAIWHDSGKWRLTTSPNCSFLLEQTKAGELRRLVCPTGTDGAVLALQDRMARAYTAPGDAAAVIKRGCLISLLRCMEVQATLKLWQEGPIPSHIQAMRGTVAFFAHAIPRSSGPRDPVRPAYYTALIERQVWQPPPPSGSLPQHGAPGALIQFEDFMALLCQTKPENWQVQHMLAVLGVILEWYNPNHFTVKAPSKDLERLWVRMSKSKAFSPVSLEDSDGDDADGGAKGVFSQEERHLILNGILFPVWLMKECPYNANAFLVGDGKPEPTGPFVTYTDSVPHYKPYMTFFRSKFAESRFAGWPLAYVCAVYFLLDTRVY
jgi:hypothetical protein